MSTESIERKKYTPYITQSNTCISSMNNLLTIRILGWQVRAPKLLVVHFIWILSEKEHKIKAAKISIGKGSSKTILGFS